MNAVSILVVDDDDDVRSALLDELSPQYAVTGASCGVDAFAALCARHFDVIISDLRMPDHDGIEVLDFARAQQAGIIRILLTGYVDDRAHEALLRPDAPYKVGKPWYDEIDVVLRRALEQRRRADAQSASLASAFGLAQVEAAFAAAADLEELGELLALRIAMIDGVVDCCAVLEGRVVAGHAPPEDGSGWRRSARIDGDGRLVLVVRGHDDDGWALVAHLLQAGQRRSGVLSAPPGMPVAARPRRSRIDELMRQATMGAMVGSVLHDVAGMMQGVEWAVRQLEAIRDSRNDPDLAAALQDIRTAGDEAVGLFIAMRKFLRDGRPAMQSVAADELVARTMRQVGGLARARATLRVAAVPALVRAAEPLFVQALAAVLRNAAAASPADGRGTIDVEVRADGDEVAFVVTDDGAGVASEIVGLMFEPHVWHRPDGVGVGLAIAAHAMRAQDGVIAYRRAPGRGACFTLTLPRG